MYVSKGEILLDIEKWKYNETPNTPLMIKKVVIIVLIFEKYMRFDWLRVFPNLRFTSSRVSLKKGYINNHSSTKVTGLVSYLRFTSNSVSLKNGREKQSKLLT
jgi:hypothetical protein